jgi:hypothetical protein
MFAFPVVGRALNLGTRFLMKSAIGLVYSTRYGFVYYKDHIVLALKLMGLLSNKFVDRVP